jgi:hypothetical protein
MNFTVNLLETMPYFYISYYHRALIKPKRFDTVGYGVGDMVGLRFR